MARKDVCSLYGAMICFVPFCPAGGHQGFILHLYGWNRDGGFSKLTRLAHARAQYFHDNAILGDKVRSSLRRRDWTLVTPCTMHVAAKGIPWKMQPHKHHATRWKSSRKSRKSPLDTVVSENGDKKHLEKGAKKHPNIGAK